MPLTQISGFRSKITRRANFTQSAGVPLQLYSLGAPSLWSTTTFLENKVLSTVMACPMPDWGLSGATTTTSPSSFMVRIRALRPGAVIPSSLVTNMSGFSILHNYRHKNTFFIRIWGFCRLTKNYNRRTGLARFFLYLREFIQLETTENVMEF